MKRITALCAALGFAGVTFAEQSYDRVASGEALPEGESAYGYSMSDPYTDGTIIVQEEYLLLPSDTVVLIPLEDEESVSHFPG